MPFSIICWRAFGEQFDDALLQSVDPLPARSDLFLADLASWKSSMLMTYPRASSRRACGFNYGATTLHPLPFGSGLEHRLYSLLGIGGAQTLARYPLSRAPLAHGIGNYICHRPDDAVSHDSDSFLFESGSPTIMAALLNYGANRAYYRLQQTHNGWHLYFDYPGAALGWPAGASQPLLHAEDRALLETRRDQLIAWLQEDGGAWQHRYDGEGLYVVEHLLLRPLAQPLTEDDGFYSSRLSVVFPDWPVRFQNHGFRQLAERLVAENCPAQLGVDCYWLSAREMGHFERIYAKWAQAKQQAAQAGQARYPTLDAQSHALRHFIERLARRQSPQ